MDSDIEFLPALSSLSEVTLNSTRITDRSVEVIANLHELRVLNLELTAIGDVGVARLRSLKRLEWLGLDGTRVTDNALPNLAALPLKALGLNSTAVSDHSVQILMQMTDLEQLGIADTPISFKGVLQLSGLKHLRCLIVHRDQFASKQLGSLEESFGARLAIVDWDWDRRRNGTEIFVGVLNALLGGRDPYRPIPGDIHGLLEVSGVTRVWADLLNGTYDSE